MNEAINNGEINLFVLFLKFLLLIKKYFIVIIVFTILGIIYAFWSNPSQRPYYATSMVAASNMVSNEDLLLVYKPAEIAIQTGDYANLSSYFGIGIDNLKAIKQLSITPIEIDPSAPKERSMSETRFTVHLELYDLSKLDSIKKGFLYYLANNQYIKERFQLAEKQLPTLFENIEKQISSEENNSKSIQNTGATKTVFAKDLIELYQQKQQFEVYLKLGKPVMILADFFKPVSPITNSLSIKSLIVKTVIFFFLGLFVAFTIELFKLTNRYEKSLKADEQKKS